MGTKIPRKLAAVLAVTTFGAGSALVSAALVAPPQVKHEVVAALPGGGHVVDKSRNEAMQVLIFIHRANLPVGGVVQGAQR